MDIRNALTSYGSWIGVLGVATLSFAMSTYFGMQAVDQALSRLHQNQASQYRVLLSAAAPLPVLPADALDVRKLPAVAQIEMPLAVTGSYPSLGSGTQVLAAAGAAGRN